MLFFVLQTIDGFTTAIMVVISVCFLPASYAIFVVKERAVKAKHQQASHSNVVYVCSSYSYSCCCSYCLIDFRTVD